MHRVTQLIILCCCALLLANTTQAQTIRLSGDSWETTEKRGVGRITITYIETPLFIYKNEAGKLSGLCVDILKEFILFLEKEKGVRVILSIYKPNDDFNIFLSNVINAEGGVFGLANITITDARKKVMKFTRPYIKNRALLASHESLPTLYNLTDMPEVFAGCTAFTVRNSTFEQDLLELKQKYFPEMSIEYISSAATLVYRIAETPQSFGKIDFPYYVEANKQKLPVKVHPVGSTYEDFGFIMPLNSDWKGVWDEFLEGFVGSTRYRQLLIKHFGKAPTELLLGTDTP
ncbi:substrate-binding periplasmic protein [Thermonema rossianum]|uniref:substrate-binding periplasmic protein n=1 Tax=Thermonema rossianum TaxID=55505 RepID=UPI00056DE874|nr:transporter substrate-binding domain-containing protein [Thermonema rossianum]